MVPAARGAGRPLTFSFPELGGAQGTQRLFTLTHSRRQLAPAVQHALPMAMRLQSELTHTHTRARFLSGCHLDLNPRGWLQHQRREGKAGLASAELPAAAPRAVSRSLLSSGCGDSIRRLGGETLKMTGAGEGALVFDSGSLLLFVTGRWS